MKNKFTVLAALHEDISAPFIWTSERSHMPRPLAILTNTENQKKGVCQVLKIDENFRVRYDSSPRTVPIPIDTPVAIMSEWYRACLGVKTKELIEMEVKPACRCFLWFAQLRASFYHPDHSVRLAADLAIVSVFLGLIGLALGILAFFK